jgi:hypothetical protein
MKIKKSLIEQIVKEEIQKIKEIKVLQEEKKNIQKQLDELYKEEMDEGIFSKKDYGSSEEFKKFWDKKFDSLKLKNVKRPNWTIEPSEEVMSAARKYKTFDLYYHPTKKEFLPKKFSAKGHSFGGGSDAVTVSEE